jgi:hypothetical protein
MKKIIAAITFISATFSVNAQEYIPLNPDQLVNFFRTSNYNIESDNNSIFIDCTQIETCTAMVLRNEEEVFISHTFGGYYDSNLNKSFVTIITAYPDGSILEPIKIEYDQERKIRSKRGKLLNAAIGAGTGMSLGLGSKSLIDIYGRPTEKGIQAIQSFLSRNGTMYNGFTPSDRQFAGPSRNLGREIGGGGNVADRPGKGHAGSHSNMAR